MSDCLQSVEKVVQLLHAFYTALYFSYSGPAAISCDNATLNIYSCNNNNNN